MTFFIPASLLLGEAPGYLVQVLPKTAVQRLAAALGDDDLVVFTLSFRMA
jgi:hypothetical protein